MSLAQGQKAALSEAVNAIRFIDSIVEVCYTFSECMDDRFFQAPMIYYALQMFGTYFYIQKLLFRLFNDISLYCEIFTGFGWRRWLR